LAKGEISSLVLQALREIGIDKTTEAEEQKKIPPFGGICLDYLSWRSGPLPPP
jgi:hypothetical protein